jgi:hypothetical protein
MDFDADGTLFATCETDDGKETHVLITIDPSTGEGTGVEVGPTGIELMPGVFGETFTTATDISFRDSDGALFAYLRRDLSGFSDHLATIDKVTGTAELKGFTFTFGIGNGIAFSPGEELFHADEDRLNTLDQSSGIVIPGRAFALDFPSDKCPSQSTDFDCRVNAMDFNPDGTLFASVNHKVDSIVENFLATIETTTGVVTIKGQTVPGLDAIAFAPAATATPPAKAELGSFKCYGVKRPKRAPKFEEVEMTLYDRFDGTSETRVGRAMSVCTPVPDVSDSTAGLTCYKIKDKREQEGEQTKFQELDLVVGNELFGEEQALTLKKSKVICVPSTIEDVPEAVLK